MMFTKTENIDVTYDDHLIVIFFEYSIVDDIYSHLSRLSGVFTKLKGVDHIPCNRSSYPRVIQSNALA